MKATTKAVLILVSIGVLSRCGNTDIAHSALSMLKITHTVCSELNRVEATLQASIDNTVSDASKLTDASVTE